MTLNKLRREYEERRAILIEKLHRERETMELSKQHQMYGAVKEIENFLKSIDHHLEQHLHGEDFELKREGPEPLPARTLLVMREVSGKTKSLLLCACTSLKEGVKRPVRSAREKILLIREVAREVKKKSKSKSS